MIFFIEGSLEVKLPTIWTDEKQRWKESERREERRSEKRKSQKKEDADARKGRKVAAAYIKVEGPALEIKKPYCFHLLCEKERTSSTGIL